MNWEQFEEERKQQLANQTAEKLQKQFPEWFVGNKLGPTVNIEEAKTYLRELVKQNPEILPFEQEEIEKKALAAITTSCLLLVEKEITGDLLTALKSLAQFKHWHFTLNNSNYPDIVVFSRKYLNQQNLSLSKIRTLFPKSRIILLAGNLGDRATGEFIENAQSYGFSNIVTGDVPNTPGDRPYTLPVALMYDRDEIISENNFVINKEAAEIPNYCLSKQQINQLSNNQTSDSCLGNYNKQEENAPYVKVNSQQAFDTYKVNPAGSQTRDIKIKLKRKAFLKGMSGNDMTPNIPVSSEHKNYANPIHPQVKEDTAITREIVNEFLQQPVQTVYTRNTDQYKGKLIVISSTKGGVAKTTTSIMISLALAKSGIPNLLIDADFEAPDCATFFKIKNVPGIEKIAGKPFSPEKTDDVIFKVNEYLHILPGPMDTTSPHFEPGQLEQIVDYLVSKYPVVIVDTPPEFWEDDRQKVFFTKADRVYSILTQSAFSQAEARDYAPKYALLGVSAEKIGLILTMYDPELISPKELENSFSANLKIADKKFQPRFEAIIPVNTREFYKGTHDGKIVSINHSYNQIHLIVEKIAEMAGYKYETPKGEIVQEKKKTSFLSNLLGKFRRE
ncbi:AAA domain-containing protein [Desulforamulus putei DSM 12395]|uniref:AAA domain-containing protein n=1 Tax=Desulforamulus putei DSM 12395 TaxID=1121429 RepID=A0A1M5A9Q3_9FIRM|nr:AAA family ATPase [Desulforamulus putei]SHF26895.1 AAA domain-containing protein [Desulforamulus putei DSM 12395]